LANKSETDIATDKQCYARRRMPFRSCFLLLCGRMLCLTFW